MGGRSIAEVRGPGVHHAMMVEAKHTTKRTMKSFEAYVMRQCAEFGCGKCTPHCKEYIKKHPPTKHPLRIDRSSKKDLTAFEWAVNYRNAINIRIGKTPVPFETAYDAYYGEKLCNTGGCDSSDEDNSSDVTLTQLSQKLPGVVVPYNGGYRSDIKIIYK